MPKQYCVGAVEKAIKILNFLAEHPDSSFSEIFTALELSKSTTYQTLSTLGLFHAAETGDLPLTRIEQEWSDTYNGYREEG